MGKKNPALHRWEISRTNGVMWVCRDCGWTSNSYTEPKADKIHTMLDSNDQRVVLDCQGMGIKNVMES